MVTNDENLRQYKSTFSLTLEQTVDFALSTNLVRNVKNMSPNSKQIAWWCFMLLNVIIEIGKSISLLNFKQFHQTLYLNSFLK